MKKFIIDEQQMQFLWNTLVEFPAIKVINSLDMIRNLKIYEEKINIEDVKPY